MRHRNLKRYRRRSNIMSDLPSTTSRPLKILQASAGSGKTFSLTAHYLTLLFSSENKYREILAVTFTNKATEEMKSRILEVLRELATGEPSAETFRNIILSAHRELNPESLQQLARRIYRRILHDYSRFAVNTIDGFVQKVIRSFSYELGLDNGYKLEMNMEKVKQDLAAKLNQQLDKNPTLLEWVINLALDRVRDNKNWNYHETLINLASEIFKERYLPFEEALHALEQESLFNDLKEATEAQITFFEAGITELAKEAAGVFKASGVALDELKGKSKSPLSCLDKIVHGDLSRIPALEKLENKPEAWQKGELTGPVAALYERLNPLIGQILAFNQAHAPAYHTAKVFHENLYYLRLMQEMAGLLKEYRQENQSLLISDAQNLLKGIAGGGDGNPSFIWEKMGSRYRHFLFDEFQDTSSFQWQNFLPLVRNAISEANGRLTDHLIVGDVKQSIYRWRNGDWRILHSQAKMNVGELLVVDDNLQENYRSAANIIDFNNFLFKYAPQFLQTHLNGKVSEDGGEELASWWQDEGYDRIITSAYGQSFQQKAPSTPKGGSVEIGYLPVSDARSRSSEAKEEALKRLSEKLNSWFETSRYKPGQICILVRTNGEAREVIEFLMQDQQERDFRQSQPGFDGGPHVPYEVMSGEALLIANNPGVRLLVNTLRAMAGKRDETALYQAICIFYYNQQHNRTLDPGAWLKIKGAAVSDLRTYLPGELCDNWTAYQQLPLPELIEQLIAAYGLDKLSLNLPYLLAFRDMVSGFVKFGERGLTSFIRWWEEEGESRALPSSEQSDAVQVMTIHKSKGLAFDVVMMPFCSWNLDGMPNSIFWVNTHDTPYSMLNTVPVHYKKALSRSDFAKDYFEEVLFNYMDALNMLYVATTRTRKHLYITAPAPAGKDEQFSLAGDLIRKPLLLHAGELGCTFESGELVLDEPPELKPGIDSGTVNREEWTFRTYPLSDRLNEALTDKKVWGQLDLLSGNTSQRKGIILHEVLARVNKLNALPQVVKQMQAEGWFRRSEEAGILELAGSVLLQPDLKKLLDQPFLSYSEQTIINGRGESYRPDKVLIGEDRVVIIDFKFTGEPKPEHAAQVEEYRQLLLEMGYRNIEAFLYYGYLKELKAV